MSEGSKRVSTKFTDKRYAGKYAGTKFAVFACHMRTSRQIWYDVNLARSQASSHLVHRSSSQPMKVMICTFFSVLSL